MKELLLLSPENQDKNKPTKILDKSLKLKKSFSSGFLFQFQTVPYENFHEALGKIFQYDSVFLTLGELTEYGETLEETRKAGPRRKKKGSPTIKDKEGTEIVLDLDDHILEDYDATEPEPAIRNWLKERKINCDVTWQVTSGQKMNTEEARIRLYFTADKAHSLRYRKAWSQSAEIQADGSVYTCSQPIYIAPPIIEGGKDPIKQRHGFIKQKARTIKLPKITEEQEEKFSSYTRGGEEYDFEGELPEDVISGKVYRRYFMPLAFHFANKGLSREDILQLIKSRSALVKSREFNADNVYAYIDDAVEKISSEVVEKGSDSPDLVTSGDLEEDPINLPLFPEDLLSTWPAPWPMLWENFKRIPRVLEEPLLVPTILSLNSFFLRASCVTGHNRRPNLFFLNLTPSTGNKDVNSKNVIRDLDIVFKGRGALSSMFSGIINTESSITADTTFLQAFSEDEELFWINTESTRIFQQIRNSGGNSNVAALSDKLIEVVDGHEITGKVKAAGKVKTIEDPNAQILFYAQPETIEKFIDEEMVDSGLFGRSLLSIIPELKTPASEYNMFMGEKKAKSSSEVDDAFFEFYCSKHFNMASMTTQKRVLMPNEENIQVLNEWARKYVLPRMQECDSYYKVLSRIGNSAEQIYTMILGICQIYDRHIGEEPRKEISIMPIIPLLEYWVETKIYAIKNLINTELDPLAESVMEVIRLCLVGKYKSNFKDMKIIKDDNMVPKSMLLRIMRNNAKLIRRLSADNDKRNAMERIERIIRTLTNMGLLVEKEIRSTKGPSKTCIGLLK